MNRIYFLLFASLLFVPACSDDEDTSTPNTSIGQLSTASSAGVNATDEPPSSTASSGTPTLGKATNRGSASGPRQLARRILQESLNTTVEGTSRFENAPLYELDLSIDYELFTYTAHETLHYLNTEQDTLEELVFLVYPNSPELAPEGAQNLAVSAVTVDGQSVQAEMTAQIVRIPLPRPLAPGQSTTVDMDFRGNIVRLSAGATDFQDLAMKQLIEMVMGGDDHHGGYGVYSYADGIVSLALWYPILASYDEDGWDLQPGTTVGDISYFDVANYALNVHAPRDVVVISTGVATARTESGQKASHTFLAGAVRELTVQMSKDYVQESSFVDGVKVSSWFLESDRRSGEAVLQYGTQALKLYNEVFGPYPYTELELVEAPLIGGAGGVEFPGLTTIAKMFYATDDAPQDGMGQMVLQHKYMQDTLEFVVAHEVAHQWWNAVVGSDSKRHPFVDEALANHSAILYFERIHGAESAEAQREMQLRLPYQISRLIGANDRPVDLPTAEYADMTEYAAIVYGKGALFFEELRRRNGDATHLGFLSKYYSDNAFRIATPDDLVGGLVRGSRDPAATQALVDRWLHQSHGDEDIGGIRFSAIASYLFGPEALTGTLATVLEALDHQGAAELAKLAQRFFQEDGSIRADIDYGEIISLALTLMGSEEDAGALGSVANLLGNNPALLESDDLRNTLKTLAKSALGDDPQTSALIDMGDVLLRLLEED